MKNAFILSFATLALSACAASGSNQVGGAALGGVAGGVVGSMFGGGTGRLVGTGIGAAIGTAVGAGVGASIDRQFDLSSPPPPRFGSAGEREAYERGRSDREAQIQALREQRACERGFRGY